MLSRLRRLFSAGAASPLPIPPPDRWTELRDGVLTLAVQEGQRQRVRAEALQSAAVQLALDKGALAARLADEHVRVDRLELAVTERDKMISALSGKVARLEAVLRSRTLGELQVTVEGPLVLDHQDAMVLDGTKVGVV